MELLDHKLDQLIDACETANSVIHDITEIFNKYLEEMKNV